MPQAKRATNQAEIAEIILLRNLLHQKLKLKNNKKHLLSKKRVFFYFYFFPLLHTKKISASIISRSFEKKCNSAAIFSDKKCKFVN
jgi:hypothetical protein